MQSRRHSLIESVTNVAVGYGVAVCAQIVIFPLFGIQTSIGDDLLIAALFTLVSLVRSYAIRRIFNRIAADV